MAKIVKVDKEPIPNMRLVGKKYGNAQRRPGFATAFWEEWFMKDWFGPLQQLEAAGNEGDAYIGSMRFEEDRLVYWIGMFRIADCPVPPGYDYLDIPAGEVGVLWIKGSDDHNLYNMHQECIDALQRQGMITGEKTNFYERYTQTRFVTPDADGHVILDYCAHL